jgi:hypothetical protein
MTVEASERPAPQQWFEEEQIAKTALEKSSIILVTYR